MRRVLRYIRTALLVLALVEIAVRLSGVVDFPLYEVDSELGYLPRPNQHGRFLNSHEWAFNDRSMATGTPWNPARHRNVLLIGNSVIMGGNPYDQKDKVGPRMQELLGDSFAVWPIATGGWSEVNETAYLSRNSDVADSADFFIWEYMNGSTSRLSLWRGDYVFPTRYPLWATDYAVFRYILPHLYPVQMDELPPVGPLDPGNLRKFEQVVARLSHASKRKCPGILFFYPDKTQLAAARNGKEWVPERREVEGVADRYGLKVVDVARSPDWDDTLYRDQVHPSKEGNAVLAGILASAMKDALALQASN